MRGQRHAPAALYSRERRGTHCTGGWVGHRAGVDRCRKSRPPPGFDPRTVQPVASRYTDYATRPTLLSEDGDNKTVNPIRAIQIVVYLLIFQMMPFVRLYSVE